MTDATLTSQRSISRNIEFPAILRIGQDLVDLRVGHPHLFSLLKHGGSHLYLLSPHNLAHSECKGPKQHFLHGIVKIRLLRKFINLFQCHQPPVTFRQKKTIKKPLQAFPFLQRLVALPGFEPRQADPESDVLPLHHRAESRCKFSHFSDSRNNFLIFFQKEPFDPGYFFLRDGNKYGRPAIPG